MNKGSYDKRISQKLTVDLLKLVFKNKEFPFEIQDMKSLKSLPVKFSEFLNKEMDFVYLITKSDDEQAILHIEVQSSNDSSMHQRMLLYLGILRFQYPKLNIYQICLYIGHDNCTMENVDIINEEHTFRYHLASLKDIPYEEFLKNPNTIGFSILGDFSQQDEDQVLNNIFNSIYKITDESLQNNLFTDLIIFGNICNLSTKVRNKLVEDMIIDITTNPVYIEALEKGLEKGLKKGLEKGLEKGKKEGLEKGKKEGLEKGLEKGKKEGLAAANYAVAKKMLLDGFESSVVQKYTGLSDDDLLDLRNEIKKESEK